MHDKIQYWGMPEMTSGGIDVMAFHLHRFLAAWMAQHDLARVWVTVGFELTECHSATFCVEPTSSVEVSVGWTFDDLRHTYRAGDSRLHLELPGVDVPVTLHAVPILDRPAMGGQARVILGFVLVPQGDVAESALTSLQTHTYEAVCASRRNTLRLFFDEHRQTDTKSLLYGFMNHLPEWTGCDYSAMMILTSTLETMTLEESPSSQFHIIAERLFFDECDADAPDRLVGMTLDVQDASDVLAAVYERQRLDPELPYHIFVRDDAGAWASPDRPEQTFRPFHRDIARRDEAMYVFVPMVAHDSEESELLGFLGLTFRQASELSSSMGQMLDEISEHLTPLLRHSSLYTLSARKLWLLRRMNRAAELAIHDGAGDPDAAVDRLVQEVSGLIADHVAIPSFGIAWMRHETDADQTWRTLRYAHARGWAGGRTALDMRVDVDPADRLRGGVSSLAVRLGRPLVLAGGYGEGDNLAFKNSLFVHEDTARVMDVRAPGFEGEGDWVPLSEYYQPARTQAYATLAYPIMFCDAPIGVLSVEVDKETNWLWWTGFGGHLFWQLVASELAHAFHALGVRAQGEDVAPHA